ncbi:M20 family metallo-hydrolase [Arthrobacter sp. H14]|uniref:M20 family metallo-hydrolase n=1 Tax=Arthrobacter sp. H14 TaxID=1312959 RepID=UPI0004BABE04|nr:M20 family metallo-hydrolase [Arthrobacter sp. H14]
MKPIGHKLDPSAERLEWDLTELSSFRDPDRSGWTREVFSDPYRQSRQWMADRMRAAGLEVHVDPAGNIIGRRAGKQPGAPAVVTGSHTDTVDGGGRFDGVVGVLGALEAVRQLTELDVQLNRDLLVVDFLGEESNDFGLSCLGSRALAGELTAADLQRTDRTGTTLGESFSGFGIDPSAAVGVDWARRTPLHSYLELHIEQGPTLEQRQLPLGIVTGIAGIERLLATFIGSADHAGTRPMGDRQDAMVAAAEAVLAIRREGCGAPNHGVATTTRVEAASHSPNVVPGLVRMMSEVRSVDAKWLSGTRRRLGQEIQATASSYGVDVDLAWSTDNELVQANEEVQEIAASSAASLDLPWTAIPSGATHDAVHMASLAPMGMIFIPSHNGKSHCPEEWTDYADIAVGVRALAASLINLDQHAFQT